MWKGFENSIKKNFNNVKILYDKFHIIGHLQKAIDNIRKNVISKVSEDEKRYIKGNRCILLSREKKT